MGYIKEPAGVDFVVDPTPLSTTERKRISEIIAYYKATGRKPSVRKQSVSNHSVRSRNKKVLA